MDDFIKLAVQQFGLSEADASKSTGVLLGLIQQFVGGDLADRFLAQIPGAQALLEAAGSGGGGGGIGAALGGLLGGDKSGLGDLIGKVAGGADALSAFQSAGLETSKIDDFVGAFSNFAQGQAGEDLTHQVIGQLRSKLL